MNAMTMPESNELPVTNMRAMSLAIALVTSIAAMAQFTLVATSTGSVSPIGSLNGGVHLIDEFPYSTPNAGTRNIYLPDLTLFRVLNYPAPPSGFTWSNMGYITENLFDTDPSDIEFVLIASDNSGMSGLFVFREDGAELFQQMPGSLVSAFGAMISSFDPIFTTDAGTFMVVNTGEYGGPPMKVYQLEGTLPCSDCHGTPLPYNFGLGTAPTNGMATTATVSHDATAHALHVLPGGMHVDEVSVLDATGRLIITQRMNTTERFTIDAARLAPGVHIVVLQDRGIRVASMPVVVR